MGGIQGTCILPRTRPPLTVRARDLAQIQPWLAAHGTPPHGVRRGRIMLAAARGPSDRAVPGGVRPIGRRCS